MKKIFSATRTIAIILAISLLSLAAGCSKMEKGGSDGSAGDTVSTASGEIKIPEIKSDDTVMPKYFDISLYDEENYADIYLGKKFAFNVTYCGSKLSVPSSYKQMEKDGWHIIEDSEFNENSTVLAGSSVEVVFVNGYNNHIDAVFYNDRNSSATLKKCDLVKFKIKENIHDNDASHYGQFWVNGISNDSAITDIVDYLGAPSHFYAVSETEYYLDYFIFENDKRSGITVYVNPTDDTVSAIEFSYY